MRVLTVILIAEGFKPCINFRSEPCKPFRRTVFNIVVRNPDDHVRHMAFLMDGRGQWRLSPAYDVAYSHNPGGWTGAHQMSATGKRDNFEHDDLLRFADVSGVQRIAAVRMIGEVVSAVANWPQHGAEAVVPEQDIRRIGDTHRTAAMTTRRATPAMDS